MYSFERMPASSLAGLDMFNFASYWNAIKNKIADLQALGPKISAYQQRIAIAQQTLLARGGTWIDTAHQLDDELAKINDDLQKWWKVKGYLDSYLPEWMNAAGQTGSPVVSNLSFLPLVLGAVSIAALAYVVNTGMALYQDYQYKTGLTQAVIEQKLTSGQAAEILSIPPTGIGQVGKAVENVMDNLGMGFGIGLPVTILIGAGVYFAFTQGMFKSILGGSSSPSS